MGEIFSEVRESLGMRQVAEHFGYHANRSGFILSPYGKEKTASCRLYRNSYYDFSANVGGDVIKFAADILHVSNWEACQYLAQTFSLPVPLLDTPERREEIGRQQRERKRQKELQEEFKEELWAEVSRLKGLERMYRAALDGGKYPPMSGMRAFATAELQKVSYRLDILCAADQEAYRRMKPDMGAGIPSDRPRWLLDTLAVLAEAKGMAAGGRTGGVKSGGVES